MSESFVTEYFRRRALPRSGYFVTDSIESAEIAHVKSAEGVSPAFSYAFKLPAEAAQLNALLLGLHLGDVVGRRAIVAQVRKIFERE